MTAILRERLCLLLTAVAMVAGAILVVRSVAGPFQFGGIPVTSPLPMESLFALSAMGLLIFCLRGNDVPCTVPGSPLIHLAVVLAIIALAFARNLNDPFLSDDYILVTRAVSATNSFWPSLTTAGGDGAFRPLGSLYYQLTGMWAHTDPFLWHLAALLIHLFNSAMVFLLAWRVWGHTTVAIGSALLFGLHGTRPEVVVWTAGNFDLLACALLLLAIHTALAGKPWLRPFSLLFIAAAILCKESAYTAPVFAWALMHKDRRLRSLLRGSIAVCVVLFAYRWYLFHGPGGYIDPATGQPQILSMHLLPALKAICIRVWAILLFPVNWESPARAALLPLAVAGMAIGYLWMFRVAGVARLSLIAATSLAVLPAVHLALIGESGLGSRILYLPSVIFCLLMGSLARDKRAWAPFGLVILSSLGLLEHNLAVWHKLALQARSVCQAAPASNTVTSPASVDGVFFFRNGFAECVSMERDRTRGELK